MSLADFFIQPLAQARHNQQAYLAENAGRTFDLRTVTVLLSVPLLLTLREYAFNQAQCWQLLGFIASNGSSDGWLKQTIDWLAAGEHRRLTELGYWSLGQVLCFFVLPALVVKVVLRERLGDYGCKLSGLTNFWWAYLGMFLCMLPALLYMSTTTEFQATYPFYHPHGGEPLWPRFFIWQLFYASQFVALEFFFRGYMIHGLKQPLGPYCILAMTIPYCMLHYGKPLPETLGSIGAGVILGFMSLKTRSIWLGAALHIAVAVTMDLAALTNARH